MRKTWLIFLAPLLLLLGYYIRKPTEKPAQHQAKAAAIIVVPDTVTNRPAPQDLSPREKAPNHHRSKSKAIVAYALSLLGSPYVYAGISPEGFDCSGFITHVFSNYNIDVPHSSAMQAEEGNPVRRQDAKPGDIVIFTGTDPEKRTPGHVGIVISQPGDTISFVHSSSNGGVKVSKVKGTGYDRRFLEVRRIL